jgi:hypothetical protein
MMKNGWKNLLIIFLQITRNFVVTFVVGDFMA